MFICLFFVPAMLCYSRVPQGGGLDPHLCQQRDGEGCLFVCFLYLPCCVIAEYPKEEGWTHTCVSRGMERDGVFCFVFVPAMLRPSRVPQRGGLG